jgi:hypothetical protein
MMNWALFALSIAGVMTAIWILVLAKSRRSLMSIYVSFAFLLLAAMNSAAPIRGYVDPNYVGYGFGLLHATKGLSVTLMAGGVFFDFGSLCVLRCAKPAWSWDVDRGGRLFRLRGNSSMALAGKYAPRPRRERDPVRRVSNHSRLGRQCAARRASGRALRSRGTLARAPRPRAGKLVLSPLTTGSHLPLLPSQRQRARPLAESKGVALRPQHFRIRNRLSMLSPS